VSLHKIIQHAIDNDPLKMKEAFDEEMTSRLRVALENAYNSINEAEVEDDEEPVDDMEEPLDMEPEMEMRQVAIQVSGAKDLKKILEASNEKGKVSLSEMLGFDSGDEDPEYKGTDAVVYPSSLIDEEGLEEIQQKCQYQTKLSEFTAKRIAIHLKTGGKVSNWNPDQDNDKEIGFDELYYNALLTNTVEPNESGFIYRAKLI